MSFLSSQNLEVIRRVTSLVSPSKNMQFCNEQIRTQPLFSPPCASATYGSARMCRRKNMIYKFLGMVAKNYKYGMFCQQCHPSVVLDGADIRPRNVSQIHTKLLFAYVTTLSLAPLWRHGETNPLSKLPPPKNFQIFQDGCRPTCTRMLSGQHGNLSVSDSGNMFKIS